MSMIDRYAVIGNPIAHSKSPLIHTEFAAQTQQNLRYEPVLAPIDGFEKTVQALMAQGFKGANVTVPFKFAAFDLCDSLSTRASGVGAGAVNTLSFAAGKVHGDNTDGIGLCRDIEINLGVLIKGKNVLILGAGGAAFGVLNALMGANSVTIANRTLAKAQQMVKQISHAYPHAQARSFAALETSYDLVINATSAGLRDEALPISDNIFRAEGLAYDMMYGRETPFMAQARRAGVQVADGLGMLVEQAAEAFTLWRGVRPQTQPVISMLRG